MKISLLELLFPRQCLECRKYGSYLCSPCLTNVPLAKNICVECQRPSIDGVTHARCKTKYSIDRALSVFRHTGVVRRAILQLKYRFSSDIVTELTKLAAKELRKNVVGLPEKAIIVPVPLHTTRARWRGFNQSEEIGKCLARIFHWHYSDKLVVRVKNTRPQSLLTKESRAKNVKNIFSAVGNVPTDNTIILIDDVWTTGSTLKEMGKVLKKSGVKNLWSITIAK